MEDLSILNELNDVDLSKVDTGFPVLPKGAYRCIITSVKIVESKSREGGKNLEIKYQLNQNATTLEGRELTADSKFPLTHYIGMTETEKYSKNDILRNLGQLFEGTKGVAARKAGGKLLPVEQFLGDEVVVNLKVEDDEQYGKRNTVSGLLKKS